jgi:hypothetical protein
MTRVLILLIAAATLLAAGQAALAQEQGPAFGGLNILGRTRVANKNVLLKKKRFYLFRGGLEANKGLIERLKAAQPVSRDCFYCSIHASAEFMAWLKGGDANCEMPYCREITPEDVAKVPEFKAAYDKGVKQFQKKPELAQKWVVTNLEKNLLHGLYDQRKTMVDGVLAGSTPVQSALTDNGGSAMFLNVPLTSDANEKFVFANIVPVEIGEKSYVWICEADIGTGKPARTQPLDAPETSKRVKKCEVIVRELPACTGAECRQK